MATHCKDVRYSEEAFAALNAAALRFALAMHDTLVEYAPDAALIDEAAVAEAALKAHRRLAAEGEAGHHGQTDCAA